MGSKELVDFVNANVLDDESREVYHKACGVMLADGLTPLEIKEYLMEHFFSK